MSTKESVWFAESDGRSLHIYFELAERKVEAGRTVAVPMYLAATAPDASGSVREVELRIPREMGRTLVGVFLPNRAINFEIL